MGKPRRAGLQQRVKQSTQHIRLRGDGTEKIQSLPAADEQRGEGFDIQIANQISLVFNIDPDEATVRVGLCQRASQLRKNVAIGLANATPVSAQANHPRANAAGRQG